MYNDEHIKFESQLLVIDIMMKSIDEVLEFIRLNNIQKIELTRLVSTVFECCRNVIEVFPQFHISVSIAKNRLLNSIEIVQKYWDENDVDLFILNWFLFVSHWNEFSNSITNKTENVNLPQLFLN